MDHGKRRDVPKVYREILGAAPRWIIASGMSMGWNCLWGERERLNLRPCPVLGDRLDGGPQHVDLTTQAILRQCYFRDTVPNRDVESLDTYLTALASGESVLFWCDPSLRSCLGILWALETLALRGADFSGARLVLWPFANGEPDNETGGRRALEQLFPVTNVLEPLIALRRHLASDSAVVGADLSALQGRQALRLYRVPPHCSRSPGTRRRNGCPGAPPHLPLGRWPAHHERSDHSPAAEGSKGQQPVA
jgi:hypothetical protein